MLAGDRDAHRGQGCWQGTGMLVRDGDAHGVRDAGRGQGRWHGQRRRGAPGPLTGDSGAVAGLVGHEELVLEAAAPHALGADQHQRFPAEGRHAGHLLVDQQLVAVELWARDGAVTHGGTPRWVPRGPLGTSPREVPPPAHHGHGLGTVPSSLGGVAAGDTHRRSSSSGTSSSSSSSR